MLWIAAVASIAILIWIFAKLEVDSFWTPIAIIALVVLVVALLFGRANARDLGQWEGTDPAISQWYKTLMQPDNPSVSCCGTADAYWCDEIHFDGGGNFCQITDDRPDEPLGRPHRPLGERHEIPDRKLTYKDGNPTGHSIIFLSTGGAVYCFVQNGGV